MEEFMDDDDIFSNDDVSFMASSSSSATAAAASSNKRFKSNHPSSDSPTTIIESSRSSSSSRTSPLDQRSGALSGGGGGGGGAIIPVIAAPMTPQEKIQNFLLCFFHSLRRINHQNYYNNRTNAETVPTAAIAPLIQNSSLSPSSLSHQRQSAITGPLNLPSSRAPPPPALVPLLPLPLPLPLPPPQLEFNITPTRKIKNIRELFKGSKALARAISLALIIYELMENDRYMSQRDVYYSMKTLYTGQDSSNKFIFDFGKILMLKRNDMRITAMSKGFCSGLLSFVITEIDRIPTTNSNSNSNGNSNSNSNSSSISSSSRNDQIMNYNINQLGNTATFESSTSIDIDIVQISRNYLNRTLAFAITLDQNKWVLADDTTSFAIRIDPEVKYILVVEKEGVFRRLIEDHAYRRFPCIIVTGCGFPDIATRAFVALLSALYPRLEVFALCDYNPYGAAICFSYKYYSKASEFESREFVIPRMKWLGLRSDQMAKLLEKYPNVQTQPFSTFDDMKVKSLIAHVSNSETNVEVKERIVEEIRRMKTFNGGLKIELEELYALNLFYLLAFIERAILVRDAV